MRNLYLIMLLVLCSSQAHSLSIKDTINPANFSELVFEKALFDKVNELRKSKSKNPYIFNQMLHQAAEDHVNYLVKTGTLTHEQDNLKSKTVYDRVRKYITNSRFSVGENLARTFVLKPSLNYKADGTTSMTTAYTYEQAVEYLFNAWLQSSFHKKNMLHEQYSISAIAVAYNPDDQSITAVEVFAHFG